MTKRSLLGGTSNVVLQTSIIYPVHGHEEDQVCGRSGCAGVIAVVLAGVCACSVHVPPPCFACENSYLACSSCGWVSR